MLKETASFCLDVKQIYKDLYEELGGKNLITNNGKGKKNYTYINDVFEGKNGTFFYQHMQTSQNGCLIGFSIDVAVNDDFFDCGQYIDIVEQLGIDKKIPLLITYGCFNLVDKDLKKVDYDNFFAYPQGIMNEDEKKFIYTNFDKRQIAFDTEIIIKNEDWTDKEGGEKFIDWKAFFSQAKIKYKPLLELQNSEDVKRLADEIKAMTF